MEITHLIVIVGLVNILLTASITALTTFIGIRRMLRRKNTDEKYMILRKREVLVLDGKEIYELTDDLVIKSLIDKNETLQNENIQIKQDLENLKKEYKNLGFIVALSIVVLVIYSSILHLFKSKKR